MNRKPGIFRSRGDAVLCFAFAVTFTGWLIVGAAIIVVSLSDGGTRRDAFSQQQ